MQLVPRDIDDEEPCIRCVMHPLMYSESKGKLKREAVLPPSNTTDVSLLRLNYTNIDFCIKHGNKLGNDRSNFSALGKITLSDVKEQNAIAGGHGSLCEGIKADIVYGPMNEGEYVLDRDVYVEDPSVELPMHADLRYNHIITEGTVQTKMRKYASELVKHVEIVFSVKS